MRKITALMAILALALSLTGCGTPQEHYAQAAERYKAAAGITCSYSMTVTFTGDGSTYGASVNGKFVINNGETRTAAVTGTGILTPASGTSVNVNLSSYYDGEVYYSGASGSGVCYEADWSEVLAQTGAYGLAEDLTEKDFEGILEEETENGSILTYVVSSRNAGMLTGIYGNWEKLAETENAEAAISTVKGILTIDAEGNPVRQELEITGSVSGSGTSLNVTQKITTDITLSEEPLSIGTPVKTNYTEIIK